MTRERLLSFSLEELKRIARQEGLDPVDGMDRQALLEMILEAFEEIKQEREQESSLPILGEERKYELSQDEEVEAGTERREEYAIPQRYNETRVVLLVRDPHWAYAYWDIEDSKARSVRKASRFESLLLRVRAEGDILFDNANPYFDIPVQFTDSSWYIYLPHPNCTYTLELGYVAGGRYYLLCRSRPIRTPREALGNSVWESHPAGGTANGSVPADRGLEEMIEHSYRLIVEEASSESAIPQRIISLPREPADE
jgi:hypothetical protein